MTMLKVIGFLFSQRPGMNDSTRFFQCHVCIFFWIFKFLPSFSPLSHLAWYPIN